MSRGFDGSLGVLIVEVTSQWWVSVTMCIDFHMEVLGLRIPRVLGKVIRGGSWHLVLDACKSTFHGELYCCLRLSSIHASTVSTPGNQQRFSTIVES